MSESRRRTWRWRILRLRAEIDVALAKGTEIEQLAPAFDELARLYRVGPDTIPCLVPPTRTHLRPGPEAARHGAL